MAEIQKRSYVQPDGTIVFHRRQENDPILEANKARQDQLGNKHNFGKGGGNWHHVADIPLLMFRQFEQLYPNWRVDPDQKKKLIRFLNDPENRKLRIDDRRL